jgi:hypothetical protein
MEIDEILATLRASARGRKLVNIVYTRLQDGETKSYDVEPYEIKEGWFWGFHVDHGSIEKYWFDNISEARPTNIKFTPKFPIKI